MLEVADACEELAAIAKRLPALVDGLKLVAVEGGPHNIGWTYPAEVNAALLEFLGM
jgi:non-heme chloroperoxidase